MLTFAENKMKETLQAIERLDRWSDWGLRHWGSRWRDALIVLPGQEGSPLLSLSPIYEYLKEHGGTVHHEHIIVGGWPVQFLPPSNELEREAISEAVDVTVKGVGTRVMKAEHLVAIALRTGRAKDRARIVQFIEQGAVDRGKLTGVLERHKLLSKWREFERSYLGEISE